MPEKTRKTVQKGGVVLGCNILQQMELDNLLTRTKELYNLTCENGNVNDGAAFIRSLQSIIDAYENKLAKEKSFAAKSQYEKNANLQTLLPPSRFSNLSNRKNVKNEAPQQTNAVAQVKIGNAKRNADLQKIIGQVRPKFAVEKRKNNNADMLKAFGL